jgi:hypothetical protein
MTGAQIFQKTRSNLKIVGARKVTYRDATNIKPRFTLLVPYILITYMLCRQKYTVLCYLTQFLLNAAQHVSSLYKAQLQGLFR